MYLSNSFTETFFKEHYLLTILLASYPFFFLFVLQLKLLASSSNSVSSISQFRINLPLLYRGLFQITFGQLDSLKWGRKSQT